jgi:hypothetical protein
MKSYEETGNFVDAPAYQAAADMLMEGGELRAGETVGHYRILSLLGEGGMRTFVAGLLEMRDQKSTLSQ